MYVHGRILNPLARECYIVAVQVYYGNKSKIPHCCATFIWWLPVYASSEKVWEQGIVCHLIYHPVI